MSFSKTPRYRIAGSDEAGWRWTAYGANNKKLGFGRGYNTKKAAVKGARACRKIKLILDDRGNVIP